MPETPFCLFCDEEMNFIEEIQEMDESTKTIYDCKHCDIIIHVFRMAGGGLTDV